MCLCQWGDPFCRSFQLNSVTNQASVERWRGKSGEMAPPTGDFQMGSNSDRLFYGRMANFGTQVSDRGARLKRDKITSQLVTWPKLKLVRGSIENTGTCLCGSMHTKTCEDTSSLQTFIFTHAMQGNSCGIICRFEYMISDRRGRNWTIS